jgi:glucuronate isomerase
MTFIGENFLLQNKYSEQLFHEYAKDMPIIDYHNHLVPQQIADNRQYENISQVWLYGDHYKWRAMRTWGVNERYITGNASDKEKFEKWSETVPHTLRNPLYHWTHLELKRYFDIDDQLNKDTSYKIYSNTREQLTSGNMNVLDMLVRMNVESICTTDDPMDDLRHHVSISESKFQIKVLPTFRPDRAMDVTNSYNLATYYRTLSDVTGIEISTFDDFLAAIKVRHDYFHDKGCRLSDHGLNHIVSVGFQASEIESIFSKILQGKDLNLLERQKYQSACLLEFARMDHEKGWVQQFHLGALRNTNDRMLRELGPDTGFDSIGDYPQAEALASFFNILDDTNQLTKTIIYNLNPSQNEIFATMIGNYNDGRVRGKMQFGSGWWYMDQLDGMERQMNALSNMGLISCFVGMLTDSRSFLSFPRHEYFRRLLCNILGNDIEKGLLPVDIAFIGQMVRDISYHNAKRYFNF